MINSSFIISNDNFLKQKGGIVRIVFWGSERESYVTSNMFIIAGFLACQRGYRIIMLEAEQEKQGIEACFSKTRPFYREMYIKTLITYQLYGIFIKEWYREKEEKETLPDMLLFLEKNMDAVFINLQNRLDEEARSIMHNADLVVICLKQSKESFEAYFAQYANLSARIFLLIGNYFEAEAYDVTYFRKKYDIREEELAVIPNNPEFQMAFLRGNVDRYMQKRGNSSQRAIKSCFFNEVHRTVERIYQFIQTYKKIPFCKQE